MVATRQNINSWASSHEENWWCVIIKTEWKVSVNRYGKFMGVHKLGLMGGGQDKRGHKFFVFKNVGRQWDKSGKRKGIKENGGVRSPASMTRSKEGLAEGVGNFSNVSKTTDKKGLDVGG